MHDEGRDGAAFSPTSGQSAATLRDTRVAAERGDADAQFNLGKIYSDGWGLAEDDEQAIAWYRKAANQGNASAQRHLGMEYRDGAPHARPGAVARDDAQAVAWFRKAADQGDALAQLCLGEMYDNGRGVVKDDVQAVAWYRKAVDQGDAYAQRLLGRMYKYGWGLAKDYEQAIAWYRKAADQGNADAKKDLKELEQFLEQAAAERGDVEAQFKLGVAYENDKGFDAHYSKALAATWYRRAAKQVR
jgi:TPR repeat protein